MPVAEGGLAPCIDPGPKDGVGLIKMVAFQPAFPVGAGIGLRRSFNAIDGHILDKYMGGQADHGARNSGKTGGIFKGNGRPVAMAKQDRVFKVQMRDQAL